MPLALVDDPVEHITAYAYDGLIYVGGCTCLWVGPPRSVLQTALADILAHTRCEPGCPICEGH